MAKKIADFSHHQRDVDWEKASKELDLAIIRVQDGSTLIDKLYKDYVAGCKSYHVPFGHYAYFRAVSISDAEVEANDLLSRMDKDAKFVAVDFETQTVKNKNDIIAAIQKFIDTVRKSGYKCGLYTGDEFFKKYQLDKVDADFRWLARYGVNNGQPDKSPSTPCDLWQYTSVGKLAGVTENTIDLNQLNGSKPLSFFTGEVVKPEPKKVDPEPKPKVTGKEVALPKTDDTWKVYPINKEPIKDNEVGELHPSKFGGLTYDIIGNPKPDVYTIKTDDYGIVNIYAAPSTGAVVRDKKVAPKPAPKVEPKPTRPYPGKILKVGSIGRDVEAVQRALGFTGHAVDGKFGRNTEASVKSYQKRHNLTVDGIVAEKTWNILF